MKENKFRKGDILVINPLYEDRGFKFSKNLEVKFEESEGGQYKTFIIKGSITREAGGIRKIGESFWFDEGALVSKSSQTSSLYPIY